MADKGDWRAYLHERGIEDRTIEHFALTWDGKHIHIPVENRVRLYNPWPRKWTNDKGREVEESKMKWVEGDFLDATPPFPSWEGLKAAEVLCEGEWDCMLLWQNGFAAATTSAGASTFLEEWADACAAGYQPKTMLYDNDLSGRLGMVGGRNPKTGALQKGAAQVMVNRGCSPPRIAYWPVEKREKYDVTDWFVEGNDRVALKTIIDAAEMWIPNPDPLAEIEAAEGEIGVDYATENQLIGACVVGGSDTFLLVRPIVATLDFTQGNARLLHSAMDRLWERGEPLDFATLRFELQGLPNASSLTAYIAECIESVPTYTHAETYAKKVRLLAARRRAVVTARGIAKAAVKGAADEVDFMGAVQHQYDRFTDRSADSVNLLPIQKLTTDYAHLLLKREAGDESLLGIPTGIAKELDAWVAFYGKELTYICAGPGTGKTSLMKHMQALLGQRGFPSLFVSLEQPAMQLMERLSAAESKVDSFKLRRATWNHDEITSVWDALARMNKWPAWMVEDAGMTTAKLAVAVALAKQKHKIRVVFVDYVQIMADEMYEGKEAQRISTISRRLAQIARQYDVAMVVASQLNREGSEPGVMPQMRHMRESGSLEADADLILGLAKTKGEDIVRVGVLKSRSGPSEKLIELIFDADLTAFRSNETGGRPPQRGDLPALPAEAESKQEALDI